MFNAFGWVLFGMAVWGLCIVMTALQRRFAPEMGDEDSLTGRCEPRRANAQRRPDPRDAEIAELKRRIETLEAIVTDRRYQWEEDLSRSR